MKLSALRRVFLPMVLGTPLAVAGGWLTFDAFLRPVMERSARSALEHADLKGVEAKLNFYTATLRGTVPSPEARDAAEQTLNITGGWGLRVRPDDNRLKVPPALSTVEVSDTGLRAIGWVKDESEREALLDVALRQGGFERDQVDVSEVQVYPFVLSTGAGVIAGSTMATAREVSGMAWLRSFWESMPKVPRVEGAPEASRLQLHGRVPSSTERSKLVKWIAKLRPDLKVDGSAISLDPKVRATILPKEGEVPSPDSWLGPLWTSLTVRPSLQLTAATDDTEASLSGLVPSSEDWAAVRSTQLAGNLRSSPVVVPNPEEDLPAANLAGLVKVVSGLHDGFLEYASTGLTIRGEGDAQKLDALRAIDLAPLPNELVHVDVKQPDPGRLNGILDGANLVLRGVAPDTATRDALVAWVRFVRPDLNVDPAKLTIDPMVTRWSAPPLPDQPGTKFPDIETTYPWLRKLAKLLRTGPTLHYRATDGASPASLSWFGPTDLRWVSSIAAAAVTGGESNLSSLRPGGRTSPMISVDDAPAPTILGQLIGAVSSLRGGELSYNPDAGLTIRGEVTPAQEQVLLAIGAGRMDPAKVHFELKQVRSNPDAPSAAANFCAVWLDGTLSLSGAIPDDDARETILGALKEGGHRARIDVAALEVKSGKRFPSPALVADLANRFVSAPGNRIFSLTETALNLSGEVTSELIRDWKPVVDRFAQGGFGAVPAWTIYPSIYHFPSRRGGASLPPSVRDHLSRLLASNEIVFEPASAVLPPAEMEKIEAIRAALQSAGPNAKLIAGCHPESAGDAAQNETLNRRRTEAVIEALTASGELSAAQFRIETFGIVPPSGPGSGETQPRRVELLLQ
jgi:hypothetical protein